MSCEHGRISDADLGNWNRLSGYSVLETIDIEDRFDGVVRLANPASPYAYLDRPIFTLRTGSEGTRNVLDFAKAKSARFILASSSEVYGEPLLHPQLEEYWRNGDPAGPRSVYDEAKRYAEALTTAYRTACGADTGILRIFNTYRPRMHPDDGRVVSSFGRTIEWHDKRLRETRRRERAS